MPFLAFEVFVCLFVLSYYYCCYFGGVLFFLSFFFSFFELGVNPGLCECKANTLPLSYIPALKHLFSRYWNDRQFSFSLCSSKNIQWDLYKDTPYNNGTWNITQLLSALGLAPVLKQGQVQVPLQERRIMGREGKVTKGNSRQTSPGKQMWLRGNCPIIPNESKQAPTKQDFKE